ncbi:hypothetical protein [Nannocystis punicea]|uniref:Peptidase M1 membrane alanine aminopeptidase domain-containing protein n=1 Tax=Nannocystis punicea TaxID=2995304 RepID=A0ABY7H2C4_9BACT|nr:hypothetical protein [Nannocystis poenicansa]WAS93352.1 hypothetical protein O0S08_44980 [Nannocystis poenicansa]
MFQRRLRARARAALATLLGLAGCAHGSARGQDGALRWRYRVEVPAALDRLRVEVCFPDGAPRRLKIDEDDAEAVAAVSEVAADGGSARLDREAAAIVLGPLPAGACVRYSVAIESLLEGSGSRLHARVGEVVSVDPRLVLWRPATLYYEADVALELSLAEGVSASVPWPATGEHRYRLPVTSLMWASQAVFGGLTHQTVEAAGATFSVAIVDQPRKLSEAGVSEWITTAAETVATLYGRFPTERMQVVVLPFPGGGGPVYFGMALRGGGPSVQLLVSSEAADHAFPGEWVAIHEFLHHGMPFVQQADAWLSEGFVTYYTEILPTRRGFRSESAGWQALLDGFGRGRKDGAGQPLAQASREMHDNHSYQRVYWSGAALALLADVSLRLGVGERSLDAAMRHLLRCCAKTPRVWTAEAALRELDAWAGSPVFTELAASWLPRAEFPELGPVYRKLGLDVIKGEVQIHPSAPAAAVRRAIFARPSGRSESL